MSIACLVEIDGTLTNPPSSLSLLTDLAPAGVVALDLPFDGVEAGVDVLIGPVMRALPVLVVEPVAPAGVADSAASLASRPSAAAAAVAALSLLVLRLSESVVDSDSIDTSSLIISVRSECRGGGDRRLGSS